MSQSCAADRMSVRRLNWRCCSLHDVDKAKSLSFACFTDSLREVYGDMGGMGGVAVAKEVKTVIY